jgi:8-oxo-dGTP pyrophosphatase MutT (NUDIX family)
MPAEKISIQNAKVEKLFYFVATVVVYRNSDKKCLILKRSEREKVHPGRYAVPGGKLEWKDLDIGHPTRVNGDVLDFEGAVEGLLRREVKEEAGIEIENKLYYLGSMAFVRPDETPVVFIQYAARHKAGEVVPEEGAFTDHAWVDAEEAKNYPCIDGIPEEVARTIQLLSE